MYLYACVRCISSVDYNCFNCTINLAEKPLNNLFKQFVS